MAVGCSVICCLTLATLVQAYPTQSWFAAPANDGTPRWVVKGPDSSVWFGTDSTIGRVDATGFHAVAHIPSPSSPVAADGSLWTYNASGVFRIPDAGELTGYLVFPQPQAADAEGRLWGAVDPISAPAEIVQLGLGGLEHRYHIPAESADHLTSGADGNVWFAAYNGGQRFLGRITRQGAVSLWTVATDGSPIGALAPGPGGIWFILGENTIGRLGDQGLSLYRQGIPSGAFSPHSGLGYVVAALTLGPDGAMWFTEPGVRSLGRIDSAGDVTQYPWSERPVQPRSTGGESIAAGPDDTIWFTAMGQVARLSLRSRCSVPGLIGHTLSEARVLLSRAGCHVELAGGKRAANAVIAQQQPRPGGLVDYGASVRVVGVNSALARRKCLPQPGETSVVGDADWVVRVRETEFEERAEQIYSACEYGSGRTYQVLAGAYSAGGSGAFFEGYGPFSLAGHFLAFGVWGSSALGPYAEGIERIDLETRHTIRLQDCVEERRRCPEAPERIAVDVRGDVAWQITAKVFNPAYFTANIAQVHVVSADHDVLLDSGTYNAFTGWFGFVRPRLLQWQHSGELRSYRVARP